MKIIENKNDSCDKEIINIGNPSNNITIRELAMKIKDISDGSKNNLNGTLGGEYNSVAWSVDGSLKYG
jgi:nucleoside-diphosphate-sugar epimerase